MTTKQRLSASVDAEAMTAAQAAVAAGRSNNISAWVNEALHRQAAHDARMLALDDFLFAYETAHGVITEAEVAAAGRRTSARAVVVRGPKRGVQGKKRKPTSPGDR